MRILVTGGAGFIGSHLVDALVVEGHEVRVLDNLEEQVHEGKTPAHLNDRAEYIWADLRERKLIRKALAGTEVIFHEAAMVGVGQSMYQIEKYVDNNVRGTAVLLELIVSERIRLKRFVVASSMSIYGEGAYRCLECGLSFPRLRPAEQLKTHRWEIQCPTCGKDMAGELTTEQKPLKPTSVYAISKRDQEELCLTVGGSYGIPTVALRYFNVYGPRQALSNPYTGVCAIFSARIKNGNSPLIFEDGKQSRDFIDVRDIVKANLLVMTHPDAAGEAFNVGTGKATSILEVTQTLIKLYGASVQAQIIGKYRAGDIRHCVADITKLRALGYQPTVSLENGLGELAAWGKTVSAQDRIAQASEELEARGLTQG